MTRRRSSRAPRAAVSAAATGEPSRDTAVASGPQQEEAAAVTAAVVSTSPTLVPTAGDCVTVVDVTDDDARPSGRANGEINPSQPPSLGRRCW
jgi:hypothetical protein